MEQNIYDNEIFFKEYQALRNNNVGISANDLIEIPQLFELIGDVKGKAILDIGCGAGGHDRKLIDLGAKSVMGIDISEKMIEEAIKNNNTNNISYKRLSMNNLEEIDMKFDLVISSLAIHYIDDYEGLCKKVYNLLNDGGYFIFSHGHPMDSAVILNNYENNYVVIDDKKYFLISDYNNEGKRISHWFVDGVETYHRTMSHLVNGLIDAGFVIERLNESYVTDENIKINPKLIEQKDHSYFVYIKSKK
jgi:2-polyprenyl-3-methyl-5-hydroxy-6-metoxy-1,4-benzoquinol methylase